MLAFLNLLRMYLETDLYSSWQTSLTLQRVDIFGEYTLIFKG